MYTEKVMEHFASPHNVGVIENADGIGEVGNPVCGDMMTFYIKVKDGIIEDIKYQTFGCVAAIAVSSQVTDMVKGKSIAEAKALTKKAVAEALGGLPKEKMHCSNLGAEALLEAIKNYEASVSGEPMAEAKKTKRPKRHKVCGSCGMKNPITANFCMGCGKGLEGK